MIIRLGLWLKMRFITMSMVSWSGILVQRLVTSKKTKIFLERLKQERRNLETRNFLFIIVVYCLFVYNIVCSFVTKWWTLFNEFETFIATPWGPKVN